MRRRLALGVAGQLLTSALTATAIGVLVWQVSEGRVTPATGAAAAGAMVLLGARFTSLAAGVRQLYEASLFLEDFTGFVDALSSVTEPRTDLVRVPQGFSELVVDRVTFRYPSRAEPSVRDVSMEIRSGEVVALVGENGSGKTTLAKLLAGLYSADEGSICWDGADIATFDPNGLRESVAVILQDFVKFQLTAGENIRLGRPERGDDPAHVRAAAADAGADEFLAALAQATTRASDPQYLGGTDLSIGQWQRVALARALYRDAPFVILDEPTAALDPRAERALFEGIRTVFADKTVLVISHRFANVRTADRIYVLADGRVVEQGTHDELMNRAAAAMQSCTRCKRPRISIRIEATVTLPPTAGLTGANICARRLSGGRSWVMTIRRPGIALVAFTIVCTLAALLTTIRSANAATFSNYGRDHYSCHRHDRSQLALSVEHRRLGSGPVPDRCERVALWPIPHVFRRHRGAARQSVGWREQPDPCLRYRAGPTPPSMSTSPSTTPPRARFRRRSSRAPTSRRTSTTADSLTRSTPRPRRRRPTPRSRRSMASTRTAPGASTSWTTDSATSARSTPGVCRSTALPASALPTTRRLPTRIRSRWNGSATPYPSEIVVSGAATSLTDLNVSLCGITHAFPGDIDVLLVSPSGSSRAT